MIKHGVFALAVLLASCAQYPPIAALKAPAPSNLRVLAEPVQGHALLAAEAARAKAAGIDTLAEDIVDIADDGTVTLNTKVQGAQTSQDQPAVGTEPGSGSSSVDAMASANAKNLSPNI